MFNGALLYDADYPLLLGYILLNKQTKISESRRYFSNKKDNLVLFPSFMTEITLCIMGTIIKFYFSSQEC